MNINSITLLVGYAALSMALFWCIGFIWRFTRCYILPHLGFVKDVRKYGEWAVVTGATDGIGKEYARQLAKQGLDIVLISRTLSKLETVASEIENEFKVQTKVIDFDFKNCVGQEKIEKVLKNLDIGILVNNVGIFYGSLFKSCDISRQLDMVHVNIFSFIYLANIILKGMVKRNRGAIIYISSASVYYDLPFYNAYASTKTFLNKFVKSLQIEYKGFNIDQQIVIPGFVSTNMTNFTPTMTVPSAEVYVRSAIQTIGLANVTAGYWLHEMFTFAGLFSWLIVPWLNYSFKLKRR